VHCPTVFISETIYTTTVMLKLFLLLSGLVYVYSGSRGNEFTGAGPEEKLASLEAGFDQLVTTMCRLHQQISEARESLKAPACPTGFSSIANAPSSNCYFFANDVKNMRLADSKCYSKGASLLTIESQIENDAVKNHIKTNTDGASSYWISLTKSGALWFWADGRVAHQHYIDWSPENVRGLGPCVILKQQYNWQWGSANCSDSERYICKLKI